jgi:hypothetical protein
VWAHVGVLRGLPEDVHALDGRRVLHQPPRATLQHSLQGAAANTVVVVSGVMGAGVGGVRMRMMMTATKSSPRVALWS